MLLAVGAIDLGRFKPRISSWLSAIWPARGSGHLRRRWHQGGKDNVAKPLDHWLHDAGACRDDAHRLQREHRLLEIAMWSSLRGRGE